MQNPVIPEDPFPALIFLPLDAEALNTIAEKYDMIITLEEHSIIGGLYSAVMENLKKSCQVRPIGIMDTCGEN